MEIDKERLTYLPKAITNGWKRNAEFLGEDHSDDEWKFLQNRYHHIKKILGDMNKAGVKIIAGSGTAL